MTNNKKHVSIVLSDFHPPVITAISDALLSSTLACYSDVNVAVFEYEVGEKIGFAIAVIRHRQYPLTPLDNMLALKLIDDAITDGKLIEIFD